MYFVFETALLGFGVCVGGLVWVGFFEVQTPNNQINIFQWNYMKSASIIAVQFYANSKLNKLTSDSSCWS